MSPEQGKFSKRPSLTEQIAQFRLLAPPSVDQFLFPNGKTNLVFLFERMIPRPLEEGRLLVLCLREENQCRGAFLGESVDWAGGKIENRELTEEKTIKKIRQLGGAVVFAEESSLDGALVPVLDILRDNLRPESKVWILEARNQKLDKEEQDARISFLESFGLVKRKVVGIAGTKFTVWYGRMAKEREKIAVDLTPKPWFRFALAQAKLVYPEQYCKESDFGPILARCQASSFPPGDLRNLRYGFGVNLENYCGCRWEVSMDGTWTRTINCPEEGCLGIPPELPIKKIDQPEKSEKPLLLGFGLETEWVCRKCGEKLVFNRRMFGQKTEEVCQVISDLCCPQCGSVKTKVLNVRRENIRLGPP